MLGCFISDEVSIWLLCLSQTMHFSKKNRYVQKEVRSFDSGNPRASYMRSACAFKRRASTLSSNYSNRCVHFRNSILAIVGPMHFMRTYKLMTRQA